MTITPSITSIIDLLEKTHDPAIAYFSFTTDEAGDHGAIRANKEGLRRYALELLKKSVEMEERRDAKKLCFTPYEWLVSDAGYDLIRSVRPEHKSRTEIVANNLQNNTGLIAIKDEKSGISNRLFLLLIITLCAFAAAIIAFT